MEKKTVRYNSDTKSCDHCSNPKVFLAASRFIPVVGRSYKCYKLVLEDMEYPLEAWCTSTVKEVEQISDNVYKVTTLNNVYIVQVFTP